MPTFLLSLRIVAPLVLIAALAAGAAVSFNVARLDRTLFEIEESRLRFVLDELRAKLEAGLVPGSAIAASGAAREALDLAARQGPGIASISVIDAAGALLLHSGADAPAPLNSMQQQWIAHDASFMTAGARLAGGAGSVVLRYSLRRHADIVRGAARRLALAATAAVLAAGACFLFGVELLVRRMNASLVALDAALGDIRPGAAARGEEAVLAGQVRLTSRSALYEVCDAQRALASHEVAP